NLAALFALSLACHGALYAQRPAPARLTEFYLWTSFGGVLGGIFAGLLAPHLFNRAYEYPILVVAALLVLPGVASGGLRAFLIRVWPALAALVAAIVLRLGLDLRIDERFTTTFQVMLVMLAGLMLLRRRDAVQFAALVITAFIITGAWQPGLNVV